MNHSVVLASACTREIASCTKIGGPHVPSTTRATAP
jgi:hypothetical protein